MILNIFLPNFQDKTGHESSFINIYEKLTKKKVKINYFIPKINKVSNNKFKKIFYTNKKNSYFRKIFYVYQNTKKIINIINDKIKFNSSILLDGYNIGFVLSFLLSFFFLKKKKIQFIVYYREPIFLNRYKNFFYKILFSLINKKFGNIQLLTDTKILKKKIKEFYNLKSILVPIPHTFKGITGNLNKKNFNLLLPGQYRKDKGIENINKFLNYNKNQKFRLKLNIGFRFLNFNNLSFFLNNLSTNKYKNLFVSSNCVLMPYDSKKYKFSSSGIFIEAVSISKPCFVSNDTWMSSIYKNNNLSDFVVNDWSKLGIKLIQNRINSSRNKKNLNKLKLQIKKYHNARNFNKIIEKIVWKN